MTILALPSTTHLQQNAKTLRQLCCDTLQPINFLASSLLIFNPYYGLRIAPLRFTVFGDERIRAQSVNPQSAQVRVILK